MRGFAPVDADIYPLVVKAKKIHDKPIVGLRMFTDRVSGKHIILSVANDSVKLMNAVLFGDEAELSETGQYTKHRCGIQSFDLHTDGNCMILVDAMNVLHVIRRDRLGEMTGSTLDKGMMGILFAKFIPDTEMIFSTSFLQGLQTLSIQGDSINNHPFEKIQSVSAVSYSPARKFLAVATDSGSVDVFDGLTFAHKYLIEEVHFKKIRVLEFTSDEVQLLVGCDDKTLSLHMLFDDSPALGKKYSYHTGFILSASFDYGNSMFASSSADQRVILWNTGNGEPLHVFQNCFKEEVLTSVRFSNNGHYLLSGTANGQLFIHRMSDDFEELMPEDEQEQSRPEAGSDHNGMEDQMGCVPELSDSDEEGENAHLNGAQPLSNGFHDNSYSAQSPDEVDSSAQIVEGGPRTPAEDTPTGIEQRTPASPDPEETPQNYGYTPVENMGTPASPDAMNTPASPDVVNTPASPDALNTPASPDAGNTPASPDAGNAPASPDAMEIPADYPESPAPEERAAPKTPESLPPEDQQGQGVPPRTPPSGDEQMELD